MMNKEQKKNYISEMETQFQNNEAVMVTHHQGLTMSQLDELRGQMKFFYPDRKCFRAHGVEKYMSMIAIVEPKVCAKYGDSKGKDINIRESAKGKENGFFKGKRSVKKEGVIYLGKAER